MSNDLATKYRPEDFDGVIGQDVVVKSIENILEERSSRSFLFTGPSGCGKTTIARIIANEVGCEPHNLLETDAASNTGIDAMRAITSILKYKPLGDSPVRVFIIDEAHSLSSQAWQSLLKSVEEPPSDTYWIFCTTEPGKVPKTIKTRCVNFELSSIDEDALIDLLSDVARQEDMDITDDVIAFIGDKSNGSVREGLTNLARCAICETIEEAADLLKEAAESKGVIDLCRLLSKQTPKWSKVMRIVNDLKDKNPESTRIVICNYFSKVAMGAKTDPIATSALRVLECFSEPYPQQSGIAPLLLSLGEFILSE